MPKNRKPITYASFRRASLKRWLMNVVAQRHLIESYLTTTMAATAKDADAWGFTLMYKQARRHPAVLRWCNDSSVLVVHLVRGNALKILVSREVAKKRKMRAKGARVYMSTKPLERVRIVLNVRTLQPQLQNLTRQTEYYRSQFPARRYLEIEYESLIADKEVQTNRIMDFLGVTRTALSTDLIKTNPDSLSEIIENYDEVCRQLKGTPYEACLDK